MERTAHTRLDARFADPMQRVGLSMIRQTKKDLEDKLYKGKDPDPDPHKYIFGSGLERACELAQVSVTRVRAWMREIIEDAEGALKDRSHASIRELKEDDHEWLPLEEAERRFDPFSQSWMQELCSEGRLTSVKAREDGEGLWYLHVRVDERLRKELEQYPK